ncbi:MAG: hypothetical protein V1835_02700 [Candidatus Micrarchaeota archaeon]
MSDEFDLEAAFVTAAKLLGKHNYPLDAKFKPYAGLRGTISMEGGIIRAKISDGYKAADLNALTGLAIELMGKLFHTRNFDERANIYLEEFQKLNGKGVYELHETLRGKRGRIRKNSSKGNIFDLDALLQKVLSENSSVLTGFEKPSIVWSRYNSRRRLAFYDGAFNQVVVSRNFDSDKYPPLFLEYLIFHELLHAKHEVKYGNRRKVHHHEFHLDEKKFPQYTEAKKILQSI